jgi:creatinine amidohydrolase
MTQVERVTRRHPLHRLADLTGPDVERRARSGAVLLVPLGSTEQHGPHLPVATDAIIATALAEGAARHRPDVMVAPTVPYGSSGEHQGFAGTLSIGQEATELLVTELARSARNDFAHVLLVSAHGGNTEPLGRAVRTLIAEGQSVLLWSPRFGGDLHAGSTETSLLLAIAPEHVLEDRAEAGDLRPLSELLPLLRTHGVRSVSANGVLGDPRSANAEEGRRLFDTAIVDLVESIGRLCSDLTREVSL